MVLDLEVEATSEVASDAAAPRSRGLDLPDGPVLAGFRRHFIAGLACREVMGNNKEKRRPEGAHQGCDNREVESSGTMEVVWQGK